MEIAAQRGGRSGSALDAVRRTLQSERDLSSLSQEETAMLAGQLTDLLARVERVRSLGPAFAGIEVSRDVQELLVRLEAGSSLISGVH